MRAKQLCLWSLSCQKTHQSILKYEAWKRGEGTIGKGCLKTNLKREFGDNCSVCGIDSWLGMPINLEVDHTDGDPYNNIPENLRYPERSFRPPPNNDNTSIAVHSGVASNQLQVSSDNSQGYQTEMIQGGGEFMPGIFANDTFNDNQFSSF